MEKTTVDGEEEYVLLDLGDLSLLDIPPNAPYVLSGLDTMNPLLTICDKIKMIGEYEETIGTCLTFGEEIAKPVFSTAEEVSMVEEEAGPSTTNRPAAETVEPKPASRKELKPIAAVHKILKFKLFLNSSVPNSAS